MGKSDAAGGEVTITVHQMFEAKASEWELSIVSGCDWLDHKITTFELNRPGLGLAGFYDVFSGERIQLIGVTETSYLRSLRTEERRRRLRRTFEFKVPCVIVTTELDVLPEMIEVLNELKLPLLRTAHRSTPFQAELGQYLERELAPRWSVQGVMIEVYGLGLMIQGKSGVGKSETGLNLVQRGHLLIADDIIMLRRVSRGRLFGSPAPTLGHHMEIRGIGIIDVERLFGVRSIRDEGELSLIVQIEKWNPEKEYERLGLTQNMVTMFECPVPQVVLPVVPGRNLSQLIEIAALMQRLKSQGVNVAEDFNKHILATIQKKK